MADAGVKTYRGNCHCKAFVYEVDIPEFKSVGECNCSYCTKMGILWVYDAHPDSLRIVKGSQDDLASYNFGSGFATHKFCPICTTHLMCVAPNAAPKRQLSLNARAIQNFDPWDAKRETLDGACWGSSYQAPKYTGPEPTANIENGKVYHGSCHCGAVTLAVKTAPLDKDYPDSVLECGCSICLKNGYIWLYTKVDQVAVQGEEDLGTYSFGANVLNKTFCKKCGVNLTNQGAKLSEEEIAALPDNLQRRWKYMTKVHRPINLRVLNGYNIKDIKEPEKLTWAKGYEPQYVDP
ncbi:glutathione-dependent formaldehyde-activating enzyme [Cercophora newfieldiana]|uniref:Glutathione-dependent formaldehyde-activating enzyme n=1 Tax=Cercophora newfieldiana TaxID=92897 RepID=A0AA40CMN2_9PEZI|nr:glutathione-dependent formaldehyde-activating enzyme [Cercophora newfieldiana]